MIQTLVRILAWGSLLAIFIFTDTALEYRPTTPFSPNIERFAALAFVGAVFTLAYPTRITALLILLVCTICVFEILQLFVAERHGELGDVVVKSAGALIGITIGYLANLLLGRPAR